MNDILIINYFTLDPSNSRLIQIDKPLLPPHELECLVTIILYSTKSPNVASHLYKIFLLTIFSRYFLLSNFDFITKLSNMLYYMNATYNMHNIITIINNHYLPRVSKDYEKVLMLSSYNLL